MKNLLLTGVLIGIIGTSGLLYASGNYETKKGCEKKIDHLKNAIVKAKSETNYNRTRVTY